MSFRTGIQLVSSHEVHLLPYPTAGEPDVRTEAETRARVSARNENSVQLLNLTATPTDRALALFAAADPARSASHAITFRTERGAVAVGACLFGHISPPHSKTGAVELKQKRKA